MTDREGVARLTRVVRPTDGAGLMPPPRRAAKPAADQPSTPNLLPQTGVARLTPKARAVEKAAREFRQVMGRFATGVTVVTTVERNTVHGMTANGFLSVSLRPPLVLVSLGRCRMNEMLPRSGRYGVSMLAHDQQHFAAHFAAQKSSPVEPTFMWQDGLPLLEGALAHLGCRVVDVHRAGDHVLWIGEVQYIDHRDDEPLLFYTGRFGTLREVAERTDAERTERPG
ncbi:MAG TPA: flavin reductase family protein [Solirubrobacteraceae bacterium]|nr:flavin reductase family protein [Solirubrobacteraceae bacterium]